MIWCMLVAFFLGGLAGAGLMAVICAGGREDVWLEGFETGYNEGADAAEKALLRASPTGVAAKGVGLREYLADYAHGAWSEWMHYLFEVSKRNQDGSVTIPAKHVDRWERLAKTPYAELSENEKVSDRVEADRILRVISFWDRSTLSDKRNDSNEE